MQTCAERSEFEVIVVGAGPAGLMAALAVNTIGVDLALLSAAQDARQLAADTRTTALFGGSIEMLRHIGAWTHLEPLCAPLTGLRIVDDTGALLRAPETLFRSSELGLPYFGYNVANVDLTRVLSDCALSRAAQIKRIGGSLTGLSFDDETVIAEIDHEKRALRASLVVGADGRGSVCRRDAGIATRTRQYPQAALATRFGHARPHQDVSTEFHRRAGPLTTVPLPGARSSVVWVDTPAEIDRLAALRDEEFARALEDRLQGLLGSVSSVDRRAKFPLAAVTAETMGRRRVALVGEAAHVLPPIGAQGLNLGFRDAAWLAEILPGAKARGTDLGASEVLEAYDEARRTDVSTRTMAVDLLNRSLTADLLPFDLARGAGIVGLNALPWLRRLVMREGIQPTNIELPRLLKPSAADGPRTPNAAA